MKLWYKILFAFAILLLAFGRTVGQEKDTIFLSHVAHPSAIKMYWKAENGKIIRSIQNLKQFIEEKKKQLLFATNGGMYLKDNSPQGLYIENVIKLRPLDTLPGAGNFYLKPNGVFYLTKQNEAFVCQTKDYVDSGQVNYATQSGPMLLIDGKIHPAFKKGSTNFNIRNGVGILPDNRVVFVMSKQEVNFYDFAKFFQELGCQNALYLDGFVSRTYLPVKNWKQVDGNFGVMIGEVK